MNPAQIQEMLDLIGDRHMSTTDILHAMVDTDGMGYNEYRRAESLILRRMIYLTAHGYTVRILAGESNRPTIWAVA